MDFYEFVRLVEGNKTAARTAFVENPELLNLRNIPGEKPLHYLVVENQLESVKFLKELGSNINTADYFYSTPLMHAVRLQYNDMIDYLLSCGADIDSKTVNGDTALSYAVMSNDNIMSERLLSLRKQHIQHYFDGITASEIVSDPNTEILKKIVDLGLRNPYDV
jgi:ankyrin repeat protein